MPSAIWRFTLPGKAIVPARPASAPAYSPIASTASLLARVSPLAVIPGDPDPDRALRAPFPAFPCRLLARISHARGGTRRPRAGWAPRALGASLSASWGLSDGYCGPIGEPLSRIVNEPDPGIHARRPGPLPVPWGQALACAAASQQRRTPGLRFEFLHPADRELGQARLLHERPGRAVHLRAAVGSRVRARGGVGGPSVRRAGDVAGVASEHRVLGVHQRQGAGARASCRVGLGRRRVHHRVRGHGHHDLSARAAASVAFRRASAHTARRLPPTHGYPACLIVRRALRRPRSRADARPERIFLVLAQRARLRSWRWSCSPQRSRR